MGHLGGLFLLFGLLSCFHVLGQSLPACHKQLEFSCSDGLCIPRMNLCDGHADCKDGSDEHSCGSQKDEFTCCSRRCTALHLLCEGVDNCGERSDKTSCQNCTTFTCGPSDTCLPRNKLCNGHVDCRNGWDESEELCGLSPACKSFEFRCGDGQCIPQTWRCDNSADCSDGSDENNCDHNECKVNNGGCSHKCVDLQMGFLCDCPDNMRLVQESRCEDIDTCLESDVCDQLCVHMNGSPTCACHKDYWMNAVTGECKAKGDEAQLAFTSSEGLRWMSITGTKYRQPALHLPGPGPVAALASNRTLYWAKQGGGAIYRVSMDEKQQESVLVLRVEGTVSGLALDWIHQLLYWTSMKRGSVDVGLLDGSAQRPLLTGLDKPSAVAVDPLHGLLFWAQCGSSPKIERARLDGQDRMALVTYAIRRPVALSLDMPRQLLYWLDQETKTIFRVNLEGHHRKTVVESNGYLDRPFGLAVFEGFVYWSEEMTQSICRANKHDGRNLEVLLSNNTLPGGVVIVQPALQPDGPSVCGHARRVCQHKCVIDLLSESLRFRCVPPEPGQKTSPEVPAISHTVPASDPTLTGILSLILFLSVLLVGMILWRWKKVFKPSRPVTEESFSFKESQDPLISQGPPTGTNVSHPGGLQQCNAFDVNRIENMENIYSSVETLRKPDLDCEGRGCDGAAQLTGFHLLLSQPLRIDSEPS